MDKEIFRYARSARVALLLAISCGLLATGVTIAQMSMVSTIVNGVFVAHQGISQVTQLLLLLLGTIVVRAALVWLREVIAQEGALRVKSELRTRVFSHLLQLGPAYSKGESTGELVATLGEGIERLDAYIGRYMPQMALSVLVPLIIAVYIFPLDWMSAVLLLITGPIIPLLMVLVGSYAETHIQRQWSALSRMSGYFLDVIQGLPTLKLFNRSGEQRVKIAQVSDSFRDTTMKVLRFAFLSGAVLEFLTSIAIALVAVTLGIRLLDGGISFAAAFLVLLLAPEFYRPLRELGVHRHAGMEGKAAAARISEILRTPLPVTNPATPAQRPERELTLAFTDVTYTYPGSPQPALDGVNLVVPARTCTALIGRSGAGKSTLVNLLLRFMDVQSGTITVNGIPLGALPVETWREYIALVPQKPYLFAGSVQENIRLARPGASDDEVRQAAEMAGATEFIADLPRGYATPLGERGTRLSAGQAQRIAIARAFLKDAPLLLLDEPTSSLDPGSEALIRQALERLVQDRTVLVIAHRYNTIAHATQVARLEQGRISRVGPPAMMLAGDASYAHPQVLDSARKVQPA